MQYEHLWWNMFIVSILTDISSSSLICYDSSAPRPRETVECGSDMMCYSEYYAVNRSGTVRQYFDRFCVHRQHCEDRGIDEKCQTLQQLDKRVQRTFFTYHHGKPSRETLIQSHFCCCETDRCNNFDIEMSYRKFKISSITSFLPYLFTQIIAIVLFYLDL